MSYLHESYVAGLGVRTRVPWIGVNTLPVPSELLGLVAQKKDCTFEQVPKFTNTVIITEILVPATTPRGPHRKVQHMAELSERRCDCVHRWSTFL